MCRLLTMLALFVVGAVKGRLARVAPVHSRLEVVAVGFASGLIGFALGRIASLVFGVEIQ